MWLLFALACQSSDTSKVVELPKSANEPIESNEPRNEELKALPKVVSNPQFVNVYFAKQKDCIGDCIQQVERKVLIWNPQLALDALYNGPLETETTVRFLACESTGASIQSIKDGVAVVNLKGGCGGCGAQTVADLIEPTLLEFDNISVVQIYDPQGRTQMEGPNLPSRPSCLEP